MKGLGIFNHRDVINCSDKDIGNLYTEHEDGERDELQELESKHSKGITHLPKTRFLTYPSMEEELKAMHNLFDPHKKTVAIDGASACGKTTLVNKFPWWKINMVLGESMRYYNLSPIVAHRYLFEGLMAMQSSKNVVFDRSPISNIAWQMAYYLITHYHAPAEPHCFASIHPELEPHGVCLQYVRMHNLGSVLDFLRGEKLNIIIIIDSDANEILKRIAQRDTPRAKLKASVKEYALHVAPYAFLANSLDLPCFDLAYFRIKYGLPTDKVFEKLQYFLEHEIRKVIATDEPSVYPPFCKIQANSRVRDFEDNLPLVHHLTNR